jgi:hypothetical protein
LSNWLALVLLGALIYFLLQILGVLIYVLVMVVCETTDSYRSADIFLAYPPSAFWGCLYLQNANEMHTSLTWFGFVYLCLLSAFLFIKSRPYWKQIAALERSKI